MNKFYLLILFFISFLPSHGQTPDIQWQKTLGGTNSDIIYDIKETPDGGYIAAGSTLSNDGDVTNNNGNQDAWVVKLSNTGIIQWQKTFGGLSQDYATRIQLTTDGGYIFAGGTHSNTGNFAGNHGSRDAWIVKINISGDIQWQAILGGSNMDSATDIKQTSDGGYIFSGLSNSNNGNLILNHGNEDIWVVKLSATGTIQWQRSFGGSGQEWGENISQTSDGGYIIAGFTTSNDGDLIGNHESGDAWVIKLDNTGVILWQKTLGGTLADFVQDIQQTSDGGFIFLGDTESNDGDVTNLHGSFDLWVVKLDNSGSILWQKTYGSTNEENARGLYQTSDNGYIVLGFSSGPNNGDVTNNHGGDDYWLLKLDENGMLQWQKSYGGTLNDNPTAIGQTSDGGYITAGFTYSNDGDIISNHGNSDGWVIKLGPGGNNPPAQPQYANLQSPVTFTGGVDTSFIVYGQVYVSGLTDVVPNISGQAPGIQAWVGISPVGQNINPAFWSNWISATHNAGYVGNNDVYFATINNPLAGTYYYATRYLLSDGSFVYGGINSSGVGNFWDGINYNSGVLTVTEPELHLEGVYNVMVEKLNTTGGPYYFTNETVNATGLNLYRTTNTANFYPQGGTPGSTGTFAVPNGQPGYTFKRVGNNMLVEFQTLFNYYSNNITQSQTQFNASTYDWATGIFRIEYTITYTAGNVNYRSTYNPINLGINPDNTNTLSYYPNPVKDILNITGLQSDSSFEIYNYIGQQVSIGNLISGQNQINISNLAKGCYIIKITSGIDVKTIKVIRD